MPPKSTTWFERKDGTINTNLLTAAQSKLFEIANRNGIYGKITAAELDNPPWELSRRLHWTWYVPDGIDDIWRELSLDARLVAYIAATEMASLDPGAEI